MRSIMILAVLFGCSTPAPDAPSKETVAAHAEHSEYTCPMHPEIVQDEPGTCSKCGMDLVKAETLAADYTCPMCAGVHSDKAGACPKCGMDLVKGHEGHKH